MFYRVIGSELVFHAEDRRIGTFIGLIYSLEIFRYGDRASLLLLLWILQMVEVGLPRTLPRSQAAPPAALRRIALR